MIDIVIVALEIFMDGATIDLQYSSSGYQVNWHKYQRLAAVKEITQANLSAEL